MTPDTALRAQLAQDLRDEAAYMRQRAKRIRADYLASAVKLEYDAAYWEALADRYAPRAAGGA